MINEHKTTRVPGKPGNFIYLDELDAVCVCLTIRLIVLHGMSTISCIAFNRKSMDHPLMKNS